MHKILFVCLGNFCRSPTAEGVFAKYISDRNIESKFKIDSAGTAGYHIDEAPDERSQSHAKGRGYNISHLRGRKVNQNDFEEFDYIFAMDKNNLRDLLEVAPAKYHNKIHLYLQFAGLGEKQVPDPYYGGAQGFEEVIDLCEEASENIISKLL